MRWYHYVAYLLGGAFLANALPHLGNGISGHAFQSPFASPPGQGLSSSTVNVLWGLFNLAVGYLLVCRVGRFDLRNNRHVLILGLGILADDHAFINFHSGADEKLTALLESPKRVCRGDPRPIRDQGARQPVWNFTLPRGVTVEQRVHHVGATCVR